MKQVFIVEECLGIGTHNIAICTHESNAITKAWKYIEKYFGLIKNEVNIIPNNGKYISEVKWIFVEKKIGYEIPSTPILMICVYSVQHEVGE